MRGRPTSLPFALAGTLLWLLCSHVAAESSRNFVLMQKDAIYSSAHLDVSGIAVDKKGNIIISDKRFHGPRAPDITIYNKDDELAHTFREVGNSASMGVDVDNEGIIWVAGAYHATAISGYTLEGRLVKRFGGKFVQYQSPIDVAADSEGNIYAVDGAGSRVHKFTRQGKHLVTFGVKDPRRVAVSPDCSEVYIVSRAGLERYDAKGTFLSKLPGGGFVYVDQKTGEIYTNIGRQVAKLSLEFEPEEPVITRFDFGAGDIALGPEGHMYVPGGGLTAYAKFSPEGEFILKRGIDYRTLQVWVDTEGLQPGAWLPFDTRREQGAGTGLRSAEKLDLTRTPSAFIKQWQVGARWRKLPVERRESKREDKESFAALVPEDCYGFHLLRVLDFDIPEPPGRELMCEFWLGIASPDVTDSVSIFTDRGQRVYGPGQPIDFCAVIRAKTPLRNARLQLAFRDERRPLCEVERTFATCPDGAQTSSFRIPGGATRSLRPGAYTIEAMLNDKHRSSYEIELAGRVRPTSFDTILKYEYRNSCFFSDATGASRVGYPGKNSPLKVHERADDYFRLVTHAGFNRECDRFWGLGSIPEPDHGSFASMARRSPGLPAVETAYIPNTREAYLAQATRYGMRIVPMIMGDVQQSPFLPGDLMSKGRGIQRLTQIFSRYPCYEGLDYDLGSFVNNPFFPSPAHNAAVPRIFKERYGYDPPSRKERQAVVQGKDPEGKCLKKCLDWHEYYSNIKGRMYKGWNEAMDDVRPGLIQTTAEYWGATDNDGRYVPGVFKYLNQTCLYYQGEWFRYPLQTAYMADVARRPGKPVMITQENMCEWCGTGEHLVREMFQAVIRRVDGVGNNCGLEPWGCIFRPGTMGVQRSINRICTVYGDLFRTLEKGDDVAVLYSIRQSPFSAQAWRILSMHNLSLLAHQPTSIIYDEDLRAGLLAGRYKVLILTGAVVPFPEPVMTEIRRFQDGGGTVLLDQACKIDIAGAERMDFEANTCWWVGTANATDVPYWSQYAAQLPKVPAYREAVFEHAPPLVDTPNPRIILSTQKYQKGKYVFVLDDMEPPYTPGQMWQIARLDVSTWPAKPTLTLARSDYVIYDLFAGEEVEAVPADDGKRKFEADLSLCEVRIFGLLPARVDRVEASSAETLVLGDDLPCRVRVLDAGGQAIEAAVPIELKVFDATGATRHHVYRAAVAPHFEQVFPTAVNDPVGTWRIWARERLTGRTCTRTLDAQAPEDLAVTIQEQPDVEIFHGDRIRSSLKKEGADICMLVTPREAHLMAEAIAKTEEGLGAAGVKVNVKKFDKVEELGAAYYMEQKRIAALPKVAQIDKEVGDLSAPMHGSGLGSPFGPKDELEVEELKEEEEPLEPKPEPKTTEEPPKKEDEPREDATAAEKAGFTFPDEVILFGRPGEEGPILRDLRSYIGTLPRRLSTNYPGRGRGVVQYVWSPMRYRSNATVVYGGDEAGLDKALNALFGLLKEQPKRELPAPPKKRHALSAAGSERSQEPVTIFPNSFGACLHQIAFSPDGKYLVASAKEWANNVFFLSSDGKLLWKDMAGKCYSSIIGITEDASRVAVGASYPDNVASYAVIYDTAGKAIKKYATYAARWRHSPSFCLARDGSRMVVGGSYGMVAWDENDRPLWHEDFWRKYKSREDFESKQAVKLALSGDNKHLAVVEYRSPQSGSKPARTTVRMTELDTREVLWSYTFPPKRRAAPGAFLCSHDGRRVFVALGGVTLLEQGKKIFSYGSKTRPNTIRSMQIDRNGERLLLGEYGGAAVMVSATGKTLWRFLADGDVQSARLSPDGKRVVLSTNRGTLYMLDSTSKVLWKKHLGSESVVRFHPSGQSFVTADTLGRIKSFALDGTEQWEVNISPEVWRDDLYTKIYADAGDDIPVVAYRPKLAPKSPIPKGKNLALGPGTKVSAWSRSGWAYRGGLGFKHELLINGKTDDLDRGWYSTGQLYNARPPYARITLPKPKKIDALVTWHHKDHPECQVLEALVEAWTGKTWKPVARGFHLEGNIHVFRFDEPVTTDKILYSAYTNLKNNVWITEIGLYGPE